MRPSLFSPLPFTFPYSKEPNYFDTKTYSLRARLATVALHVIELGVWKMAPSIAKNCRDGLGVLQIALSL